MKKPKREIKKRLHILSLGMGVQSTALYYMASMGEIPRFDYAIFVDTGKEKAGTLKYLEYLLEWKEKNNGIPIVVVRKKNLYQDLLNQNNSTGQRFSSIPAFTIGKKGKKGMLRRQCTNEYKIEQVDRQIRLLYELQPGRWTPPTTIYKGISLDEIDRMSIPQEKWKTQVYPFCGYQVTATTTEKYEGRKMTRQDIVRWYIEHGLPIPPKSSCTFCPYQSDAAWKEMKEKEPEDFHSAVLIDRAIRNSSKKGVKNPLFLHESLKPLEEVDFESGAPDLWHGECSGGCHT